MLRHPTTASASAQRQRFLKFHSEIENLALFESSHSTYHLSRTISTLLTTFSVNCRLKAYSSPKRLDHSTTRPRSPP
ncbi:hypothetical protein PCASD_03115 [Puccinia coronata f. sp. avenae]|uniref:Uncharacterized protein n=1 Tax=Puccinia coronata f. sp. avenae TaxID=200324 RepID=A0A2N5V5T3_9BASI|nr:hypothetical protein PCASD_03115 [Puccinia coronata f. sp. avenae]